MNRKSGAEVPPATVSSHANSNGIASGGTSAGSSTLDAPSLVALSANLVAVVGWEAAASGAGGGQSVSTSGRLRAVVVDMLYGTVQAVHRRAIARSEAASCVSSAVLLLMRVWNGAVTNRQMA